MLKDYYYVLTTRFPMIETATAAIVTKKTVEKLVNELFDIAKRECGKRYAAWKTDRALRDLYKRLKHVRFVKTLLQPERAVDLFSFYYESKLLIEAKREIIRWIAAIPASGNV